MAYPLQLWWPVLIAAMQVIYSFGKRKLSFFTLLLFFTLGLGMQTCQANSVEQVQVKVVDESGQADKLVLQRMATSLQVVAEQILAGKQAVEVEQSEYVYKTILSDIGNRVFTGYNVEQITITGNSTTLIEVTVRPWQAVTKSVQVNIYLSGIDSLWSELIKEDIAGLDARIEQLLTGISLDAVDWAGILAKNLIRETVNTKLPSFKANVDIINGENVVVEIVLMPVGNSVQEVTYDLRSDTMPSLVLLDARSTLGNYARSLRGLPIVFLHENKDKIEIILQNFTQKERIVKTYDLTVDVDIIPKSNTEVSITLDSAKYRFWIEGYVDVGRDDDNLSGMAHIGRLISRKDEIFLETTVYANEVKWKFDPGISRTWKNTRFGIMYRLPDNETILRLEYRFLKNWQIRVDKFSDTSRPEFALRYRIHEFLAAEFVLGKDKENYVRIVGNL